MHCADVAVDLLSCFGIDGVGVLCKITVSIYDLLKIEDAVVTVLAVPEEVEET